MEVNTETFWSYVGNFFITISGMKVDVSKRPALDLVHCHFFPRVTITFWEFDYLACSVVYSCNDPTTNPPCIPLYTWQPCTPPCSSYNGVEVECHKSHMAASNWSSTTVLFRSAHAVLHETAVACYHMSTLYQRETKGTHIRGVLMTTTTVNAIQWKRVKFDPHSLRNP